MFQENEELYSNMSDDFQAERDEEEITIKPYEVDCLPNDYNVTTLVSLIERGYLKIPSFQRNYVWKKDMASKFIESIIIGLPIPQLFLFERGRNNFLVIDGQQRLVTVYLFKKQRFPKNDIGRGIIRKYLSVGEQIPDAELSGDNFEDFKLKLPNTTAEKNPLNGLKYDTLSTIDNYDFKGEFDYNRTLRTITIKQIAPSDDDSSMFEIFSRLNSGGILLKAQEIRMSLYYSKLYETIVSVFNLNSEWRRFLGKDHPDLHMGDVEALVRSFALLEMSDHYKSPLRTFLNEYSKEAMKYDETKIESITNAFNAFWDCCRELPDNAFKNESNKFVVSLFESVFVAICEKIQSSEIEGAKIAEDSLVELKADPEFSDASQGNTASSAAVSKRLARARSIIRVNR